MVDRELFLRLVRLALWKESSRGIFLNSQTGQVDWQAVEALAQRQGLSAIIIDGIELLEEPQRPPKMMLLQWIGEVLQNYEQRYESYRKAISEIAGFYNKHGFKMMVLKGYSCSLNWPKPEHRPCGDIDIWLFGQQKEADTLLKRKKGIIIDAGHHHHTVFCWRDFMVENHFDFVNVYAENSSRELEKIFKELGQDDTHFVEVYGERVYLPPPNLHALFLIRHMVSHFAAAEIDLRQVLDWACFVKKYTKEIDWEWLLGVLDEYHMKDFFNLINAICVEDLGFSADIYPCVQFLPNLKERVLMDILEPKYSTEEPPSLFPRLIYKYRRWQGNAWKQKLCYKESRWAIFITGVCAKLLKPRSI